MIDMREKANTCRQRLNHAIRREKINKLLKQRRKLIISVSDDNGQLSELYGLIKSQQVADLNRFLQLLIDELHKDIHPDMCPLLEEFLEFALGQLVLIKQECHNLELLLEAVGMICFDLPNVDRSAQRILDILSKVMFSENTNIRMKCLLGITNLSYGDSPAIINIIYASQVLEALAGLLEDYPVTDDEKQHMLGFLNNISLAERKQHVPIINLLEYISASVSKDSLMQPITGLCSYLLDEVGAENTLTSPQFQSVVFNLINGYDSANCRDHKYFTFLEKVFSHANRSLKLELLERGITMLVYYALTHHPGKVRKAAMALLFECLAEDCVDYLTHIEEMSKYVSHLMKCFFEDTNLRFQVLRVLNRAVSNTPLMCELVLHDEQFEQVLAEYDPLTETENEVVFNLLELLELLLRQDPKDYIHRAIDRICHLTYNHPNSRIAELSDSLLHRIANQ